MTRLYRHRVNTIAALETVPMEQGIEFDLRSDGDRIIVTHDPFTDGPKLDEFLSHVGPRPCIFNVKCEGIEEAALASAARHGIDDLFLLDCSLPAMVKLIRRGESRLAVRWSEFEPAELAARFAGKVRWVWIDCFTDFPADDAAWRNIEAAFRTCVVSPELQGHEGESGARLRNALAGHRIDAACTKRPELWR